MLSNSRIIQSKKTAKWQPLLLTIFGLCLWGISLFGTVLSFGKEITMVSVICALVFQLVCSLFQVCFVNKKTHPAYFVAIVLSTGATFLGLSARYADIVANSLHNIVSKEEVTTISTEYGVLSFIIIFVISCALDLIPESILVEL